MTQYMFPFARPCPHRRTTQRWRRMQGGGRHLGLYCDACGKWRKWLPQRTRAQGDSPRDARRLAHRAAAVIAGLLTHCAPSRRPVAVVLGAQAAEAPAWHQAAAMHQLAVQICPHVHCPDPTHVRLRTEPRGNAPCPGRSRSGPAASEPR
jgi:hypothetical protein